MTTGKGIPVTEKEITRTALASLMKSGSLKNIIKLNKTQYRRYF